MKNVTITLDERSLMEAKKLAASRGLSLNRFIQELVRRSLKPTSRTGEDPFFAIIDELKPNSGGWKWNREEVYEDAAKNVP